MAVETPDYLIGIGGGGSKVVESIMRKEWLIRDVVERDVEADDQDASLRGRTVDSANGNEERMERLSAEDTINSLIEDVRGDFDAPNPDGLELYEYSDNVNFDHYNYVENTEGNVTETSQLTHEPTVNRRIVGNSRRVKNWWLKDHPDLLSRGFEKGVNRRRALSKALYRVSSIHTDSKSGHPSEYNVSEGDQVVIVVSLGGGTGSGSFLDIAADMHEDAEIHLFAVIPDAGHNGGKPEGGRELSSAYAALSELEYLELENQSPFDTVTLVPYLQRRDIDPEDFEDAVADTILAHQRMLDYDTSQGMLDTETDVSPVDVNTFNVAVPRIIKYDHGIRDQARDDVEEYLKERREQLETEQSLYDTVEKYLSNNFRESFGRRLDDSTTVDVNFQEEENKEVHALARRLEEQLQGELLDNDLLQVAGVEESVELLGDAIDSVYTSQFGIETDNAPNQVYERIPEKDDAPDRDSIRYAEEIVRQIYEQVPGDIVTEDDIESFDETLDELLAGVVVQEIENVGARYRILRSIYATNNGEIEGLEPRQVRDLKTALVDVVLDSKTRKLVSELPGREIEELKKNLKQELSEAELAYAQLELFERQITQKLREKLTNWEDERVAEELELIATYHKKRHAIQQDLADLDSACEEKAANLSSNDLRARHVGRSLETPDGDSVNPRDLTKNLATFGLESAISTDGVQKDISSLIDAKEEHEEYNSSGIIDRLFTPTQEHEDTYGNLRMSVNREERFKLNTEIDQSFNVEYVNDYKEDVLGALDDRYEEAVETVVGELRELLTDDSRVIESFALESFVHEDTVIDRLETQLKDDADRPVVYLRNIENQNPSRLQNSGYLSFRTPQNKKAISETLDSMENSLKELDPGDVEGILDLKAELGLEDFIDTQSVDIGVDDSKIDDPDKVGEKLLSLYLGPLRDEQEEVRQQLKQLGSDYEYETHQGLYQAIARLVRLAHGSSAGTVELESADNDTTYGFDFTLEFEWKNHKIQTSKRRTNLPKNALIRTLKAKQRDLGPNPRDIGESNIWTDKKEDITRAFGQSMEDIRQDKYGRMPIKLDELGPSEEQSNVSLEYEELRMVNAYMSRAFDDGNEPESSATFDNVFQKKEEYFQKDLLDSNDGYVSGKIAYGDPWTLTMVTFVSGFTLDMLEPVTHKQGYESMYDDKRSEATYEWKRHSIGLAGDWDTWPELRDRVKNGSEGDNESFGAYIYRDQTIPPSEVCARIKAITNDNMDTSRKDVKEKLLKDYDVERFESTVEIR